MRLHLVGLPHTQTTPDYVWCAYTAKITKFATMMHRQGHEVYLYAGPENDAECTEHVPVVTEADRAGWWPEWDTGQVWDGFQVGAPWWRVMNARATAAILERAQPGDVLGLIAGLCQQPLAAALPELLAWEWGIGYQGVFAPFRTFESYAWQHHLAALEPTDDVRLFDSVVPNFFDPEQFTPRAGKGGEFLLFLGRHTPRKGLAVVAEMAKHVSLPVLTAGQGLERVPGAEYVGVVGPKERADLLAGAAALIAPTLYLEPFGGVAVEAMLSGTPAITTDWGAFTETVAPGVSGFRCHTLEEFLTAVDAAQSLDRAGVAAWAQRYTVDAVAPLYEQQLRRLSSLTGGGSGWYDLGVDHAGTLSP